MSRDPRRQISRISTSKTITYAASAIVSSDLNKQGFSTTGAILPTITSGSLGFQISLDNSTWVQLHDPPGTAVNLGTTTGSCAVSASAFDLLSPWPYVRLTFGAAQAASGTITWTLQG